MKAKRNNGVDSVLKRIESERIRWIDLQFVDLHGRLQHITIPFSSVGPDRLRGIHMAGRTDASAGVGPEPLWAARRSARPSVGGPPWRTTALR